MADATQQAAWDEMYDRWVFSLMFFSSLFFVVLVTALSFAWVRQELKADREWERLYGKQPTKVQAATTDPQDDRDGIILLRELRSVSSTRRNPTVGRRRKRVCCIPMASEAHRECILKRDGNCKDGSFVISQATEVPTAGKWILSILGGGDVRHYDVRGLSWAGGNDVGRTNDDQVTIEGCDTPFDDLTSLVEHFGESGRELFKHPLRKNMWSDDAMDYAIAFSPAP
eukprot:CAMPEP_0182917146 /NCGR_PEP_ID=MMETSP0105_2-20130417/1351_1 /TAXON_ID=81532 ORGANISM="Acanthoeca-like sp., Strain 10tr" /NCGR_SAMPLE_ID=MMETSP0105_2 /ASSEMBLY_ACC=CAM_ASM_000205 /LENGTH=226 /DNA_ID=CAMNT_0025054135 /DNA_START=79 /DNA_END=759 /DNA_ORIENTATION=+